MSLFSSTTRADTRLLRPADLVVTLPTGGNIGIESVYFEKADGRFYFGTVRKTDVSAYLTARQRNAFPGYDPTADNIRASDEARREAGKPAVTVGSDSTLKNFVDGVASDLDLGGVGIGGKVGNALTVAMAVVIVSGVAWWAFNNRNR